MVEARRLEYVPLDEVALAPRNPKRHDLAAVRASIDRFGYASPALRDERTGRLVVGHGRTEALRTMRDEGHNPPAGVQVDKKGRWLVPVVCGWASRSDAEADAYLVVDNHHPALGGWDYPGLAELLAPFEADDPELLDIVGFDTAQLDLLVAQANADTKPAMPSESGGGDPPPNFPEYDPESIDTEYQCPSCGYRWSGKPS